ncbi:hypothetical protein FQN54_001170 [Arachnomyces sp. PD_36]|nr:hypothetical protein FQN54_001170 [Arachnomyces sp. PD_36]
MGCGFSSEEGGGHCLYCFRESQPRNHERRHRRHRRHRRQHQEEEEHEMEIGGPTDISIHIPRNRADEHGVPIQQVTREVDRKDLKSALSIMARYLHEKNAQLTVIAVGGAVNTIFLRTRESTHDVDIFGSNLSNQDRVLLDDAMHYTQQQRTGLLGTDWFNTENQMWMTTDLHRELTNEAVQQNDVVFEEAGLKVLAAPWEYGFSGKISRLMKGGEQVRAYDLADAVHYLDLYIRKHGGRPVRVATVEEWAKRFRHTTSREYLLDKVNKEYRAQYGRDGIIN